MNFWNKRWTKELTVASLSGTQAILMNRIELTLLKTSINISPQNRLCHTDAVCLGQTRYYRKR